MSGASLGAIVAAGLAGNALATGLIAIWGDRFARVPLLVIATLLSTAGLAGLALIVDPAPLAVAAFIGLVNGMGRDRGPAQALDQSLLSDEADGRIRTESFTRYSLVQDVLGGIGSLAAAVPSLLQHATSLSLAASYRATFGAMALLSLAAVPIYGTLRPAVRSSSQDLERSPVSPESRRRVFALSGLFALDSLGGGFLAGSIISYWFFQRFGLSGALLGPIFLAGRVLNAASYLVAEKLAARLGLLRTMVFTHLPSSLILLTLPWVTRPWVAVAVFLAREALVQMDVPTRQAYVATVTLPGERTFAMAVTGLTRNVGWAVGPALAGAVMGPYGLGAPLVCGAVIKSIYDVLLYRAFRQVE